MESLGNVQIAGITATRGNIAGTDHFMMTDSTDTAGDVNVSICSFEDNNPLYKKEITDGNFFRENSQQRCSGKYDIHCRYHIS